MAQIDRRPLTCNRGHAYTYYTMYVDKKGVVRCRICRRENNQKWLNLKWEVKLAA